MCVCDQISIWRSANIGHWYKVVLCMFYGRPCNFCIGLIKSCILHWQEKWLHLNLIFVTTTTTNTSTTTQNGTTPPHPHLCSSTIIPFIWKWKTCGNKIQEPQILRNASLGPYLCVAHPLARIINSCITYSCITYSYAIHRSGVVPP